MTETCSCKDTKDSWPLHRLVWRNDLEGLRTALERIEPGSLEEKDPRGRTPLMLGVTLRHFEICKVLLDKGSRVKNSESSEGWSLLQEAVASGNVRLLGEVFWRWERERQSSMDAWAGALLSKLRNSMDFYVELKWEITSWLPLLNRRCPSDVLRIYKKGDFLRVDSSFTEVMSERSPRNVSYIFYGNDEGNNYTIYVLDHYNQLAYTEKLNLFFPTEGEEEGVYSLRKREFLGRLTRPLVLNYVDVDKVDMKRDKASKYWVFGSSEKMEKVAGYDCKVYTADNLELVEKTRFEHLNEDLKEKCKTAKKEGSALYTIMKSLFAISEVQEFSPTLPVDAELNPAGNPYGILEKEYFDPRIRLARDIGRRKDIITKTQRHRAHLWLSDNYPLSVKDQIMPIVDLLSVSSLHKKTLRNFFTFHLPSGFPVQMEVPLFHAFRSRISFQNLFGSEKKVEGVTKLDGRNECIFNPDVFMIPPNYTVCECSPILKDRFEIDEGKVDIFLNGCTIPSGDDSDDDREIDIYEALQAAPPWSYSPDDEVFVDTQFQRAVKLSLSDIQTRKEAEAQEFSRAVALSRNEEKAARERQRLERQMIENVMVLSLVEK